MSILLNIFSSEEATTVVNIIVIFLFFVFILYSIKFLIEKFRPETFENSFSKNIETSSTYQNVFAFTSVVLASTLFELFTDGKYRMIWIVIIISITTILFHVLYEKISNTNFAIKKYLQYDEHLNIIGKIMNCKGYHLILNASELEKIENRSEDIYVFTEDLITDIPEEYITDFGYKSENIGLFSKIVSANIPKQKKYTYFLKENSNNRQYVKDYYNYHFASDKNKEYSNNINFYFVKESEFTFFTELYLYKDDEMHDLAFEWLPAIGEINNADKQFYLELSSEQVENINEIIIELKDPTKKYTYNDYKKEAR